MQTMHVEATVVVQIPVALKVDLTVKANEGADMKKALHRFAKGYSHARGADLEDITVLESPIGEFEDEILTALETGFIAKDFQVTDSR